jgi:hypothetical protein
MVLAGHVPTATQIDPFQQHDLPATEHMDVPNPIQLIPSLEYANVFVPVPQAIHLFGIAFPNVYI